MYGNCNNIESKSEFLYYGYYLKSSIFKEIQISSNVYLSYKFLVKPFRRIFDEDRFVAKGIS